MTKEDYQAVKKEAIVSAVLMGIYIVLGGVLLFVMAANGSPYQTFSSIFTITFMTIHFVCVYPIWQKKKKIEADYPEWKEAGGEGRPLPAGVGLKLSGIFGVGLMVLLLAFSQLYRPVNRKLIDDMKRYDEYQRLFSDISSNLSDSSVPADSGDSETTSGTGEGSVDRSTLLPDSSFVKKVIENIGSNPQEQEETNDTATQQNEE